MKKKIARVIAVISALCTVLSFAACGNTSAGSSSEQTETEAVPEYAYSAEFTSLLQSSSGGIAPLCLAESGLYAAYSEKVGENIPEGVTPEYEGQYDINEARLELIGFDGTVKKLEAYTPLSPETDGADKRDYVFSAGPECGAVNAEGQLVLLESAYTSYSEAPAGIKTDDAEYFNYERTQTDYYLRTLDETGAEISSVKLDLQSDENAQSVKIDADGNIYFLMNTFVSVYSDEGEKICDVSADGDYIYSICTASAGDVAVLFYESGSGKMVSAKIDADKCALSDERTELGDQAYPLYDGGGAYDFYYTAGSDFMGYNAGSGEPEALFSWNDCDVNGNNLLFISVGDDGAVRALSMQYSSRTDLYAYELVTVTKKPYDSVPQKEHISLAALYASDELKNAVIKFNRASDKYRVDIRDYSEMTGSYDSALTKLETEIMAGNAPDILDMRELPYAQMAAKGLLEDLTPYYDADSELKRGDFFENVLSAYEIDGKLFAAPVGFGIFTAEGASSVVGDKAGWTYEDYYAALATMPEGCEGFDYSFTQNNVLTMGVSMDLDSFVNWSTGECNFDSDEFKRLLEYARTFTPDTELENYEASSEDSSAYRIAQGKQMLNMVSFAGFYDMEAEGDVFKTDTTYIGFPTSDGEIGELMNVYEVYAISSACGNKDAAWAFLRSLLTEDAQLDSIYFSTNKKAFDKLLADAQVIEYETDANGNYKLDENGERIRKVIGMAYDGVTTYNIYSGITPERAEAINEIVNRVTKLYSIDTSIIGIVQEQAAAYFAGQKTADEVAKLIQGKANIYVNEQR